jgi:hypothetical protein
MIIVVVGAEALPPKLTEIVQAVVEDEVPYYPYTNRLNDDGLFAELYLDDLDVFLAEQDSWQPIAVIPDIHRIVFVLPECFTVLHIREPPITR